MSTMTNDETYNGYANRETWAFNLHWQNDQGLYNETLEVARDFIDGSMVGDPESRIGEAGLGERIVDYWHERVTSWEDEMGTPLPSALAMFRDEVGSWWRIDYAEVGAAVRESLEAEGE